MAFVESLEAQPGTAPPAVAQEQTPSAPLAAPPKALAEAPRLKSRTTGPAAIPEEPRELDDDVGEPEAEGEQALNRNWSQLLTLVRKQNPNTYGLLNSCKSRHLKDNVLVLGFASDVLKNQMAKQENLEIAQQALAQVMGKDIIIRCIINTAKRSAIPAEVDHDGMVASALRDLGGEIVDIQ
jgi:hypothetical protein